MGSSWRILARALDTALPCSYFLYVYKKFTGLGIGLCLAPAAVAASTGVDALHENTDERNRP
jgi:hypothetical protein